LIERHNYCNGARPYLLPRSDETRGLFVLHSLIRSSSYQIVIIAPSRKYQLGGEGSTVVGVALGATHEHLSGVFLIVFSLAALDRFGDRASSISYLS